eukprot:m51a1_g8153 hypothetical protein (549) ;mRNA; f:54089-56126
MDQQRRQRLEMLCDAVQGTCETIRARLADLASSLARPDPSGGPEARRAQLRVVVDALRAASGLQTEQGYAPLQLPASAASLPREEALRLTGLRAITELRSKMSALGAAAVAAKTRFAINEAAVVAMAKSARGILNILAPADPAAPPRASPRASPVSPASAAPGSSGGGEAAGRESGGMSEQMRRIRQIEEQKRLQREQEAGRRAEEQRLLDVAARRAAERERQAAGAEAQQRALEETRRQALEDSRRFQEQRRAREEAEQLRLQREARVRDELRARGAEQSLADEERMFREARGLGLAAEQQARAPKSSEPQLYEEYSDSEEGPAPAPAPSHPCAAAPAAVPAVPAGGQREEEEEEEEDAFDCTGAELCTECGGFAKPAYRSQDPTRAGKVYCKSCWAQNAPTCAQCGQRILENYAEDDEGACYHMECMAKGSATAGKCAGCGRPFDLDWEAVEVDGKKYHEDCFKCSVCGTELDADSFGRIDGSPACLECTQRSCRGGGGAARSLAGGAPAGMVALCGMCGTKVQAGSSKCPSCGVKLSNVQALQGE